MRAYLVYDRFYDFNTCLPTIGGIQTYIGDLSEVLINMGYSVSVIQYGSERKEIRNADLNVTQLKLSVTGNQNSDIKHYKTKLKKYLKSVLNDTDLLIFMTHTMNFKIDHKKTISIQHGIYWDVPYDSPRSNSLVEFIARCYHAWNDIKQINCVPMTVAVDYNFPNWYRTQQYFLRSKVSVIPNYCDCLSSIKEKDTSKISIIFARRFEKYRGTRLFSQAITMLLKEYRNCFVTFAGVGPDAEYLHSQFDGDSNVNFISYKHSESMQIHSDYDIAVVSSIGSEGTSLSLLEAMGSGCAAVATNIGGMTNIILDGYNGMLVNANSEEIYQALKLLIENSEIRKRLSCNGFSTVKQAFSKEKWKYSWKNLIKLVEEFK